MKVRGTIEPNGFDDPPMYYYAIVTEDGKTIMLGVKLEEWRGNDHTGIPELPSEKVDCELEIRIKPR